MKLFFFSALSSLMFCFSVAYSQENTDTADTSKKSNNTSSTIEAPADSTKNKSKSSAKNQNYQPQLRLLFDVGNFGINFLDDSRTSIEASADYHYKNDWYLVSEAGYAKGVIDYENLKYNTNSFYVRIGADKSLLKPISNRDLDIVFFGFRYGIASGTRGDATYIVRSQFGPSRSGIMEQQNFLMHWGEMTGGIRVEMWKGIYAGWNFRAKFLLNGKVFDNKLAPNYVAGYGAAEKGTSFGFNVYVGYVIRWQQKNAKAL